MQQPQRLPNRSLHRALSRTPARTSGARGPAAASVWSPVGSTHKVPPGGLRGLGARGEELTLRSEGSVTRMLGAGERRGMQGRAGTSFPKSPPSLTAGLPPLLCSVLTQLPASSLSSNPGTFSPCTPAPTPRPPRCPVHTSKPGWPTLGQQAGLEHAQGCKVGSDTQETPVCPPELCEELPWDLVTCPPHCSRGPAQSLWTLA